MSYRQPLSQCAIAVSVSESPDMQLLGLGEQHLRDAMAEIARHLLALGSRLVYGGDLRTEGFSELLFELVARHRRDADLDDRRTGVTNYLAWPVHIQMTREDMECNLADLDGVAELICVALDGRLLTLPQRQALASAQPTDQEWTAGLAAMRLAMRSGTHARIVLGGRVGQFKGSMPGIAEEALLSLQAKQPIFLIGGFGGCTRDIAETIGLALPWAASRPNWPRRHEFEAFTWESLNNGLTLEENAVLALTPHIDQAIALVLRGLLRCFVLTKP